MGLSVKFKFKLGQNVQCKNSGVTGKIMSLSKNIDGSRSALIQPYSLDGSFREDRWYNEKFLVLAPKNKK